MRSVRKRERKALGDARQDLLNCRRELGRPRSRKNLCSEAADGVTGKPVDRSPRIQQPRGPFRPSEIALLLLVGTT